MGGISQVLRDKSSGDSKGRRINRRWRIWMVPVVSAEPHVSSRGQTWPKDCTSAESRSWERPPLQSQILRNGMICLSDSQPHVPHSQAGSPISFFLPAKGVGTRTPAAARSWARWGLQLWAVMAMATLAFTRDSCWGAVGHLRKHSQHLLKHTLPQHTPR